MGHGWGRLPYDGLIRIPLVMRCPERLPSGKIIEESSQQIDLMPTILDISGIPIKNNKQIQGLNLLDLINGDDELFKNRFILSETYLTSNNNFIRAIRNQSSKLIVAKSKDKIDVSLYDLISDPDEKFNIVKKYPQKRNYMLQHTEKYINKLPRYGSSVKNATIDKETKQRLKALGYFN